MKHIFPLKVIGAVKRRRSSAAHAVAVDLGLSLVVDAAGQAYVTGQTTSPDFPVAGSPLQATFGGGPSDAFVAKLNATGTALVYATYLGGSQFDIGFSLAVDASGNAYVTGRTESPGFPVAGSPLQARYGGNGDAFVAKIGTDSLPPVIFITAAPATLWPPNGMLVQVTVSGTITDAGSGVAPGTATYAVKDEYGLVQPSGHFSIVDANGRYSFVIQLQASRKDNDTDGRQYIITVGAQDKAGNMGSAFTRVIVPHNQES